MFISLEERRKRVEEIKSTRWSIILNIARQFKTYGYARILTEQQEKDGV